MAKKTTKKADNIEDLKAEYNEIRKQIKYAMTPRLAELINLIAEAEQKNNN